MNESSPQPQCPAAAAATALPGYAFVAVDGANARTFLQGQFTCNLDDAAPDRVLPGAYCTPKGRVIASFLLWQPESERVVLRLRADILADTVAVLNKYGVFARVKITACEPAWHAIGLLGPDLASALAPLFTRLPARRGELVRQDDVALLQRDERGEVLELWVAGDTLAQWLARLATRVATAHESDWRRTLVARGAAEVSAATREQFLPQMLGFDQSGAVHFRKGCYTGQEIVARTHYKGAVKRHLQRLAGQAATLPLPGAELIDAGSGRGIGTIVDVAGNGVRFELLAVLGDDALATADAGLAIRDVGTLQALPLPDDRMI